MLLQNVGNLFRNDSATNPLLTAQANFEVVRANALTLTKTVDKPDQAYLPGDTIIFTITLTNTSDAAINDLLFRDTIPNGVIPQTGTNFLVTTTNGVITSFTNPITINNINLNPLSTAKITITGKIA